MPINVPQFNFLDLGQVYGAGENILNAREARNPDSLKNQLLRAQIDVTKAKAENPLGAPTYAKQPFYIKVGDQIKAMQLSDQGGAREIQLPPNAMPAIKGNWKDIGGGFQLLDPYGRDPQALIRTMQATSPIDTAVPTTQLPQADLGGGSTYVEKTLPPEQTPEHKGQVAEAQETAKSEVQFKWKSIITKAQKEAEVVGKASGEAITDLARMEASLPGLQSSVNQLKKLGEIATYTKLGAAWDSAVRQSGFGATEGATARAQFSSIIDNQVLPLLRQTFGAAFTAEEGARLRATMGDETLSPQEKNAQLDAFIAQKIKDVRAKKALVKTLSGEVEDDDPLGLFK